jgi:hypothetical protein
MKAKRISAEQPEPFIPSGHGVQTEVEYFQISTTERPQIQNHLTRVSYISSQGSLSLDAGFNNVAVDTYVEEYCYWSGVDSGGCISPRSSSLSQFTSWPSTFAVRWESSADIKVKTMASDGEMGGRIWYHLLNYRC